MRNTNDIPVTVRFCEQDAEFIRILAERNQIKAAELIRILVKQALFRVTMPSIVAGAEGHGRSA